MSTKNTKKEINYWDVFYNNFLFDIPSQFCVLTSTEVDITTSIIEFGCGNGRDSIFLARHGYQVLGIDLSSEAINTNTIKVKDYDNISFKQGDVSNQNDLTETIESVKNKCNGTIVVYSRFFLHTLDNKQEKLFMQTLSNTLSRGDMIYFEFRSKEDTDIRKIYSGHYRRFVDTDALIEDLVRSYIFKIEYCITGQGMAKYKSEDPFVTRVIATKL